MKKFGVVRRKHSKLSPTQQILHPIRFVSKRADGTVRIVRDSYGKALQPDRWYDLQEQTFRRDGYQCRKLRMSPIGRLVRCINGRENGVPIHAHHIKELSRGGKSVVSNLITYCELCHDKRHALSAWRNR